MKNICRIITAISFVLCTINSQAQINRVHNLIRHGDEIIKQQVEYVDPGESGSNRFWNFRELKPVNEEYTLSYSEPPILNDSIYMMGYNEFNVQREKKENLFIGTEHNTMYYYRLIYDSLLLLGHENSSVKLRYTNPILIMPFPLNMGSSFEREYTSEGLYSGTDSIHTIGVVNLSADAYGTMILPKGDTLSPVLRTKTLKSIHNGSNPIVTVESYQWYTKGYRYPIFETVKQYTQIDTTALFSTAFYYPPQEHLYLDTDPENMALIDEMWDMEKQKLERKNRTLKNDKTFALENTAQLKVYPNPVESIMNIEYTLEEDTRVSFALYSIEGIFIKYINVKQQTKGSHIESIDCSNLQPKNYVLRMITNNAFTNKIILKK